ncbi:MAG: DUF1016 N-terminal domain-containing protein [Candidatus Methanoperedens sp.]
MQEGLLYESRSLIESARRRTATAINTEYGRGFTHTDLFNMIRFAEVFPEKEIVHALSGQLSWTNFREIPKFPKN